MGSGQVESRKCRGTEWVRANGELGLSTFDPTPSCTTLPCHNCAKHIVAAGAKRLVYIEPYPKSQVARLFRDSIALESAAAGKVLFEPFVGIAPPRFRDFFLMPDRRDENGR